MNIKSLFLTAYNNLTTTTFIDRFILTDNSHKICSLILQTLFLTVITKTLETNMFMVTAWVNMLKILSLKNLSTVLLRFV